MGKNAIVPMNMRREELINKKYKELKLLIDEVNELKENIPYLPRRSRVEANKVYEQKLKQIIYTRNVIHSLKDPDFDPNKKTNQSIFTKAKNWLKSLFSNKKPDTKKENEKPTLLLEDKTSGSTNIDSSKKIDVSRLREAQMNMWSKPEPSRRPVQAANLENSRVLDNEPRVTQGKPLNRTPNGMPLGNNGSSTITIITPEAYRQLLYIKQSKDLAKQSKTPNISVTINNNIKIDDEVER